MNFEGDRSRGNFSEVCSNLLIFLHLCSTNQKILRLYQST